MFYPTSKAKNLKKTSALGLPFSDRPAFTRNRNQFLRKDPVIDLDALKRERLLLYPKDEIPFPSS